MHRRFGTNTHKGAIFLGGLLLTARQRRPHGDLARLSPAVASVAREVLDGRVLPESHGRDARGRFGVGGIVGEALAGLPSLFDVALPAGQAALARGLDAEGAAFAMLAALMGVVEDTTALHRCGEAGLARLRADGAVLRRMVLDGSDPRPTLRELNDAYRGLGLTMGGVADLLAMALGSAIHLGWIPGPPRP
jgi:triphosphoribosyl-dephospho-CoA synthase